MAVFREPPTTDGEPDVGGAAIDRGVGDVSQGRLMYRRFKQSKLAVIATFVMVAMYLIAIFAPFLAPNDRSGVDTDYNYAPPSEWTWDGGLAICGSVQVQEGFRWVTETDCDSPVPIQWFGEGPTYKLFGLFETNRHLMAVEGDQKLLIWGADEQGRDVFSRSLFGAQVSLTVGVLGVVIGTVLGVILGTASGYFGGVTDNIIQRIIEVILSIPTLPLWATLAAILPNDMPVEQRFFFISLILSLVGWAGLARQVRGKVMSFAGADYVHAARAAGSGHSRIILTHMIPNTFSHVVAVAMLAIPVAIVAETSLSFLGIGMVEPAVSWGVLLEGAQRINVVTTYPWMMIPAVLVVITITAYQLIGDGVRDAVDPYG